jgi:hypothetical protein
MIEYRLGYSSYEKHATYSTAHNGVAEGVEHAHRLFNIA